jgi:hypothetical protein
VNDPIEREQLIDIPRFLGNFLLLDALLLARFVFAFCPLFYDFGFFIFA